MGEQAFFQGERIYIDLIDSLKKSDVHKLFIVCGRNVQKLETFESFSALCQLENISIFTFSEFEPNPKYESVKKGVEYFKKYECDAIMAIGGGSAIDVGKCIKMFSAMTDNEEFIGQKIVSNQIPLIAVPTTAGTGAESTQFAVIYYQGNKYSISDSCGLPDMVVLDSAVLKHLPIYQRKSTSLDVLAHGVESYWSINSTPESRELSKKAVRGFFDNYKGYINNDEMSNEKMLQAANVAGQAINITTTTAAHAMSYKLSSEFHIAHGHAVGLCLPVIFQYTLEHLEQCCDVRGKGFLEKVLGEIALEAGCPDVNNFAAKLEKLVVEDLQLDIPKLTGDDILPQLCKTVTTERLKNNPIELSETDINTLYGQILNQNRKNRRE